MSRAAVLVILLTATRAMAADAEPAAPSGEADLIRRGVAAREQGQDKLAYDLFKERFERYKSPRAEAQLGLAAQALGRWGEADEHVRNALGASNDNWIASNKKALEQALTVIEQHVGTLEVLGNVNGAEVLVDGRSLGKIPLVAPIRLSTGSAVVEMRAEGYAPLQRTVNVLPGQLTRETFDLVTVQRSSPRLDNDRAPVPPPPFVSTTVPTEPAPPPTPISSTWVFVGAAAATAVVGGLTLWSGLDTLSKKKTYEKMATKERYEEGVSLEHRTNWLIGSTAVLAAGTAALGLFVTHW